MYTILKILIFIQLNILLVSADTYRIKISGEQHINVVDKRFLSFTIDPKYLFSSNENYKNKECMCMASSLSPAYLRIAGPSTSLLVFRNTTIALEETNIEVHQKPSKFKNIFNENFSIIDDMFKKKSVGFFDRFKRDYRNIEISNKKWKSFVMWAKKNGFDLVFALNYDEKMRSGLWDPNSALNILTAADKDGINEMVWQLGNECTNRTIEEYLNDLETLRVITDTFPSPHKWRVVGGDVTGCLQHDSKSDFKDYVTLSSDMLDAVVLNGNSSTYELERMSERDRLKLLKILSESSTPLWLSEKSSSEGLEELSRAVDWLTSLGHAARNGFSVHFRELSEAEMYQPSLSFYMALLYKNLVGENVLDLEMESEQAILFAHCTSLRHKAVPGAVTFYGANMDDEPARLLIKLSKEEEGGDVMQFVLGYGSDGNIVVNGRPMYFEGDIKPTVKRVRPYKSLLINLPPKSFGFWVLANTQVKACDGNHKVEHIKKHSHERERYESNEADNNVKTKRSLNIEDYIFKTDINVIFNDEIETSGTKHLKEGVKCLHNAKTEETGNNVRMKRDIEHGGNKLTKLRNKFLKKTPKRILESIKFSKRNFTRPFKIDRLRQTILSKNRKYKRNSKKISSYDKEGNKVRNRRSIEETTENVSPEIESTENMLPENEIDLSDEENVKLLRMLRKVQNQLKKTKGKKKKTKISTTNEDSGIFGEGGIFNGKVISDTFENLINVLEAFNTRYNIFWTEDEANYSDYS